MARKLWARKNSLPVLVHGITLAAFFLWALLPHYHVTSHRHAHGEDHGHHFPKEYYASEETGSWPVTDSHSPGEDFGTGHHHGEVFHQHDKNPATGVSKHDVKKTTRGQTSKIKPGLRKTSNDDHGNTEKKSHKDAEYADRHTTEEVERKTNPRHGLGPGPRLTTGEALPHAHYWEDLNLSYLTLEVAKALVSLSEPPYREPRYSVPETRRWFVYSPRGPPLS